MPPAVRGRRSSRLRPCRFARRPGHDGPPSSRPASPRRRSSSVAWRPGCRDGCGQGADRSHRPASSWPGVLSPIRGMALGALRSFAFRAKAPAGRIDWMSKISNPTNHMRPARGGAFILPSVVGAPAANVVQSQTCDMPFERAMECGAYHREPVSLAKRTNRPSELGASA